MLVRGYVHVEYEGRVHILIFPIPVCTIVSTMFSLKDNNMSLSTTLRLMWLFLIMFCAQDAYSIGTLLRYSEIYL